ncbi:MAG: amidase [Promethearchaeota archaeon]|jgi:Asp-tRNA(Asn)/Glu-tRNA(Gln) amidotransferase A subunit family amidase
MNKEDICFMSALEMREKIKSQDLSSIEITETIIERIEKINPLLNAYCTPTFDLAREKAKQADEAVKRNKSIGILHGIPTSIKDLMQTKGIRTTYGSKLYEDFIPEQDDLAVQRLIRAGCVILGKTNTPEFGSIALTNNKVFGETKNPWDLERNSGGSSGGAASSVAGGIGPLALGSDGGGSIRVPSSCCGVYGLKPTFGRIPSYPRIGIAFYSMDHYGPITRYVKDAALMLNAMKGHHPSDNNSFPDDNIDYVKILEQTPKKLKIGYSMTLGYSKALDEEVKNNVLDSVQKFEQFDWEVEETNLKIKKPESAFKTLVSVGYAYDNQKDFKKTPEIFTPDLIGSIKLGLDNNAMNIGKAQEQRKRVYEVMYKYFKDYDLLITPTLPCVAIIPGWLESGTTFPTIGKISLSIMSWMTYTYPFNMTGLPAASIPSGWSNNGLPIGMQIVGRRFDEKTVLQASKAFEEVSPWQDKRPKFD